MTYDIVIVGGGTSGMACAIEAAERGVKVLVLEKDTKPGGAMFWSGGHMSAGGTQLQKRKGIHDSVEKHLAEILEINEDSGDPDLIELAVREAPNTLNWLDDLGFPWAPECPRIIYGHVPYKTERTQYGVNKAMSILETIMPLWKKGLDSGAITFLAEHVFTGVSGTQENYDTVHCLHQGNKRTFSGRNIVITTGGYGASPEFFNEKQGDVPLNSAAYPQSTGEGIKILEEAGAGFRMAKYHIPSLGGIELEPGSGKSLFNEAWAMVLTSVYRRPRDIYVNVKGERFMNEDEANADYRERAVIKQDGWVFWVIFDETALMEDDNSIMIGWDQDKIKEEARKERAIFSAPSIHELALTTGLPTSTFTKTIERFNKQVEDKDDPDFHRAYLENKIQEAPFYAIKVFASVLVTFGGITVNKDLQVLDTDGRIMKGLYAAGEALGLGATSGKAFCSGMAITPALSFGRLLGQRL